MNSEQNEDQANENQKKINSFITAIGIQIVFLACVSYHVMYDNVIAGYGVIVFVILSAFVAATSFIVAIAPMRVILERTMTQKDRDVFTSPSGSVKRSISLVATLIGGAMLLQDGHLLFPAVLFLAEACQYASVRKMRKAIFITQFDASEVAKRVGDQIAEEAMDMAKAGNPDGALERLEGIFDSLKQINDSITDVDNELDKVAEGSDDFKKLTMLRNSLVRNGTDLLIEIETLGFDKPED